MRKNSKRNIYFIAIFVVAMIIGVGYAYLSSNLNITGNATINKNTWDIHFENIVVTTGSVTATTPAAIDANRTTVNFAVNLAIPGEFYEFTVDAVNGGNIDAMVNSVVNAGLTVEQQKYMSYTVTYSSGGAIQEKQLLKADAKETIKVRVEFKKDITAVDLPQADTTVNLSFSLNYIQADDTSIATIGSVCKRATTLHTEICNQTGVEGFYCGGAGYTKGDTITYGNLGTTGTLTSGDAFDCDVNGDGTYDSNTERFYYVGDLDTNSNYAVLIYYNNVSEGEPKNREEYAYDINGTPKENGPVAATRQLPTTTQWSNVSLSNTTRKIKDEEGTEYISFSYEGYSSRLLTTQEVNTACGKTVESFKDGEFNSCLYLIENTIYTNNSLTEGYWLESPSSFHDDRVWIAYGTYQTVHHAIATDDSLVGVRPVIEVPKTSINY